MTWLLGVLVVTGLFVGSALGQGQGCGLVWSDDPVRNKKIDSAALAGRFTEQACMGECEEQQGCLSIGYNKKSRKCVLSDFRRDQVPASQFKNVRGYVYRERIEPAECPELDPCRSSPCLNGGLCFPDRYGSGGYRCIGCDAGWGGSQCEEVTDECSSSPCQNGGVCVDLRGGFVCISCPRGWRGELCEITTQTCSSYPCLVFEDTFDTFDLDTWQHEITAGGGGNWEFQYYTNNRSNSYTRDGTLFIKPTLTIDRFYPGFLGWGVLELWGTSPANLCTSNNWWGCRRQGTGTNYLNPVQSARLRTVNSFSMKYGRLEIEAKMPTGDWLWSAIWMLPKHNFYGDWPASGEIDIVESRGNRDLNDSAGKHMGVNASDATLHWGPYSGQNKYYKTTAGRHSDFGESFHNYAFEWDADGMRIYYDGEEVLEVEPDSGGFWELGDFGMPANRNPWVHGSKMAPFDKEFYIAMNVAVGGTNGYFGDDWQNAGYQKPWNNQSPTAPRDFWNAKNDWYPTWNPDINNGENAAMQIRSIRAFKLAP